MIKAEHRFLSLGLIMLILILTFSQCFFTALAENVKLDQQESVTYTFENAPDEIENNKGAWRIISTDGIAGNNSNVLSLSGVPAINDAPRYIPINIPLTDGKLYEVSFDYYSREGQQISNLELITIESINAYWNYKKV